MSGYSYMPDSPKGREIETLVGDPSAITARGVAIESLGERMQRAAVTLRMLADGTVGKGESLEALKEQAQDVHADLHKAGERYLPSGTALKSYGDRLAEVQPKVNAAVKDAEGAWEIVRSRAGDVGDTDDIPEGEDGSTEDRDKARKAAEGALTAAKGEWESAATDFDTHYDSWEAAYEHARSELKDANDDGVEDGFWDNALPFFEALVTVMEWVGVILVIAALVIGGPLLAVLAAIAALIVLIGTIVLFAKGRKDGRDLAFAVVGVLPFGKLGKLGKLGELAGAGSRFPRLAGFRNLFIGADDLGKLSTHVTEINAVARRAWTRSSPMRSWDQITGGSRFIQRVISGAPYVWKNRPTLVPRSMEMAVSRYVGYGDDLTRISDADRIFSFLQGNANIFTQTDFAVDELGSRVAEDRVDSWR